MKNKKNLPVWALVLIDFLLLCVFLTVFCYFHHIRILWGSGSENKTPIFSSSLPPQNDLPVIDPDSGLDISGDFGASFPDRFLQDDTRVSLKDDAEIRTYLKNAGYTPYETEGGVYVGLYRSHDIYLTVMQVDCPMFYEGTQKTYQEQYFIYDIYVRYLQNFYTSVTDGRMYMEDLLEQAKEYYGETAIAAINGDYLGNANHCLLAVRNSHIIRPSDYILTDICVMYEDGTVSTYHPSQYDWKQIEAKKPYQIWDFGPALLDENGKAISSFDSSQYGPDVIEGRNPHTGFGYYEPGHYAFVVFDGRTSDSDGARVSQLAKVFEELGCTVAYNLDGGNSTQAYYDGVLLRDHDDAMNQRTLFDILCVGEIPALKNNNGNS